MFREATGEWFLDANGKWDGAAADRHAWRFGQPGDAPPRGRSGSRLRYIEAERLFD
jgi:hypothetical protein